MNKLFRLGIVGTGQITKNGHLPAVLASLKTELTALVDPVVTRAQELANLYGITPKVTSNLNEIS